MDNKELDEKLEGLKDIFKDWKEGKGYQADDEFYFNVKTEDIEKSISEGLTHLANYNPLNRIIIDIKENWDSENHPHSLYEVEMINLL